MIKKMVAALTAMTLVVALAGCWRRDVVDGKAELNLPDGGTCYLLEIDREGPGGDEKGESYHCVPKAEWEKNRTGEEWVDANGKKK
jgi:hypothetical protein